MQCAIVAALLAACGSGASHITVTLTPTTGSSTPTYQCASGTTPTSFTVKVVNIGPDNASGVGIHVDMPSSFRYLSSVIQSTGAVARTQPIDARPGVSSPDWGVWDLSSPTLLNGVLTDAEVDIVFAVDCTAAPDTYNLDARVIDDNLTSAVMSQPLPVTVNPTPRLAVQASVTPTIVHPATVVTYRIVVTNVGTEIASDVSILASLPPVLTFTASVTPFAGNASRDNPVDPVRGSVIVFYGGFTLPSATSFGPGIVTVVFKATALQTISPGVYPLTVQVSDSFNDTVSISPVAPVTSAGGSIATPTPEATPTAQPSETPSPRPSTPSPSPTHGH